MTPHLKGEFARKNRFIITYPEALGLDEWVTFSSSPLELQLPEKGLLDGISDPLAPEAVVYSDLVIDIYDPITPSSAQKVMKFMADEFNCTTPRHLPYIYKKLDPTGKPSETWEVWAFIKAVDFGELNYDDDELVKIRLTLGVDHVTLLH